MTSKMRKAALPLVLIAVGACSSGGGGGSSGHSDVTFTSFGAIAPNQSVVMDATTVTANASRQADAGGFVTIDSVSFNPQSTGTVRLTYDGSRTLSAIDISTPQPNSSVSFNRGTRNHSIDCGGGTCLASSPSASGVAIDPFFVGWNYQTFGVWALDTSPLERNARTAAVFGALSAGSPTSGSALPTTGIFTFTGISAGFWTDNLGLPHATAARMKAEVDFGTRNVTFDTTNTTVVSINSPHLPASNIPSLNLHGTLTYDPGQNAFAGTVNTVHQVQTDRLSGTASGRFYGPAAQEIGGTYTLSGGRDNNQHMLGGFGGRRP